MCKVAFFPEKGYWLVYALRCNLRLEADRLRLSPFALLPQTDIIRAWQRSPQKAGVLRSICARWVLKPSTWLIEARNFFHNPEVFSERNPTKDTTHAAE
jgi:hypothetical protein